MSLFNRAHHYFNHWTDQHAKLHRHAQVLLRMTASTPAGDLFDALQAGSAALSEEASACQQRALTHYATLQKIERGELCGACGIGLRRGGHCDCPKVET